MPDQSYPITSIGPGNKKPGTKFHKLLQIRGQIILSGKLLEDNVDQKCKSGDMSNITSLDCLFQILP